VEQEARKKTRIVFAFGTRPEAIKMAPVIRLVQESPDEFEPVVIVSAQHREMLDQVLRLFDIKPDYDLNVMTEGQSLFQLTARVLAKLEKVLVKAEPDFLLVQGDTTTSFTAALAAYYMKVPIGHIEAGLRTFDKYNPFPEEMNRTLVSHLADWHFAPTLKSKQALLKEGIPDEKIFLTGNPVVDALKWIVQQEHEFDDPVLQSLDWSRKRIITVTTHRRESFGSPMQSALLAIRDVVQRWEDLEVVFPVHMNPEVRRAANQVLENCPRVHLIDPLDYLNFAHLMARSYLIMTDSGGIQEEAPSLGVPVLVMRDTTERPEAIQTGTAVLVGTDRRQIMETVSRFLNSPTERERIANLPNPYGDGTAARHILSAIRKIRST